MAALALRGNAHDLAQLAAVRGEPFRKPAPVAEGQDTLFADQPAGAV